MEVSIRRSSGSARVSISGPATVRVVADARGRLLTVLGEGRRVVLDLSKATVADVAFFQLVVSARRSFEARRLAFTCTDEEVLEAAVLGAERD